MSEVTTKLTIDPSGALHVERWQDAQDIADRAALLRDQPQFGADFHHRWSAPNTLVETMYNDYCGGNFKPLDGEFWAYMHKRMKDPQYSKFWTHNNSFFTGYNGRSVQSDI